MAPSDTRAPFLRIEWTRRLLSRPNTICRVPSSRQPKLTGEDNLFADTLQTPRTIRSCISFYTKPEEKAKYIEEVSTLMTLGDGMNGHAGILHGGIVASILDEAMGILQMANAERAHLLSVGKGYASGELPDYTFSSFTAYLNVTYVQPVRTPGPLIVTARYVKREGRKEFIQAEIKQREGAAEDDEGFEVVRARGEALMTRGNDSLACARKLYPAQNVVYSSGSQRATFKAEVSDWERSCPGYKVVADSQGILSGSSDATLTRRQSIDTDASSLEFNLDCKSCSTSRMLNFRFEAGLDLGNIFGAQIGANFDIGLLAEFAAFGGISNPDEKFPNQFNLFSTSTAFFSTCTTFGSIATPDVSEIGPSIIPASSAPAANPDISVIGLSTVALSTPAGAVTSVPAPAATGATGSATTFFTDDCTVAPAAALGPLECAHLLASMQTASRADEACTTQVGGAFNSSGGECRSTESMGQPNALQIKRVIVQY